MSAELTRKRSYRIDALKAIAMIAICLYHVGGGSAFKEGFLGVEIFFTVSGYLMMEGILRQLNEKKIDVNYIYKQLKRLWPPILCGAVVALFLGYFVMLPDNYENLAESVVASCLFAENILEAITTKNYWDVVNLYKPLMHLWYIGVLVQVQFFLVIVFAIGIKLKGRLKGSIIRNTVIILAVFSFVLYLCPFFSDANKFYMPWFRAYEILFGVLVAFAPRKRISRKKQDILKSISLLAAVFIIAMLFFVRYGAQQVRLIAMVLCTCLLLLYFRQSEECNCSIARCFAKIGQASYSIYIVHQIVVAYMYYCLVEQFSYTILPAYLMVVAVSASLMYWLIEKRTLKIKGKKWIIAQTILCGLLISVSLMIYMRAGVVKDVPELDITINEYHRGMHAEYCDEPYIYNTDFTASDKVKVLVVGNSFGRDWINVLLESQVSNDVEISYLPFHSEEDLIGEEDILWGRAKDADIVFFVLGPDYSDIPDAYIKLIPEDKLYVVGNKNFGKSNGIIYCKRNDADYQNATVKLDDDLVEYNDWMSEKYGERYVSILDCVRTSETSVRVFTQEGKFISQDCRHLTQNGAKFIASKIEWDRIFGGRE